jgi:hypothetical protein
MKMTNVLALSAGECQAACGTVAHWHSWQESAKHDHSSSATRWCFRPVKRPPTLRVVSESRTAVILASAAALVGSLWAPWYAIEITPAMRSTVSAQAYQLPGALGDFAREVLTLIPSRIEATAWQAFEKTDIVLLVCAIVAVIAALVDRMDVVGFVGLSAAGNTIVKIVDQPDPSEIVSLQWGAWLALGAAIAIACASRMASKRPVVAPPPAPDWTRPNAPIAPGAEPERTFAPF